MGSGGRRDRLVAWDVVEESLDEAEFLWTRWEGALRSHDYDLRTVWDRIEDRLDGAIGGLRVGGDEAISLYLSDALGADDPGRVASAAHALAAEASPAGLERLCAAFRSLAGDALAALRRGVELVDDASLVPRLRAALADAPPAATAALLDAGCFRGLDPGPEVIGWLSHESTDVQRAAAAASRHAPSTVARDCVERGLRAADPSVRAAAIETGVVLGLRAAWNECRTAVATQADGCGPLLMLVALVGAPKDHAALVAAAANPALRRDAVWALGFAGRRDGADLCVDLCRQDLFPALAVEALCAMGGLDLEVEGLLAGEEEPDADAEGAGDGDVVLPGPDDLLPRPDAAGVVRWWARAQGRFNAEDRYLNGQPMNPGALQAVLESGPLRRRHQVARELAIRSAGHYQVATAAFSPEQRRQLSAFASLPNDVRRRLYGDWAPHY
jgi:uncharacterized protein (TIGR02270 family)